MTYQTLRIRHQKEVCTVQLYRPEARNAINQALVRELSSLLSVVENDMTVKVVILEGLPAVFCTGMDFEEYIETDQDEHRIKGEFFEFLNQMLQSSKIIVSKVRGIVNAGGIGLIAASDLVIAEEGASFALSELLFGLLPAIVLPFLIRRVGEQKAHLLALSTQPITVAEAHRWGLVDQYGADIEQIIRPYLLRWRRVSPAAIRRLKAYMIQLQLLRRPPPPAPLGVGAELGAGLGVEAGVRELAVKTISELMADPEIKEGIRLYVEKGVVPWTR